MAKKRIWHAHAEVLSVHDGDTFKARINLIDQRLIPAAKSVDLGFRLFLESDTTEDAIASAILARVRLFTEINVRLFGVGAPELDEHGGREAAVALAELLPIGATVQLESRRLDKYGRCEAIVSTLDGRDVAAVMFRLGHVRDADARGYTGAPAP
jgi:endonuclease YncB( thermonuclease family)